MSTTANNTMAKAPRRKRRSPEEIRERVLAAAAEEFEENGFSRATTAAIARRADVTEAQIFRYFESKAALFQAAIFEPLHRHFTGFMNRRLADAGATSRLDGSRAYITELQDFVASHARMMMSLVVAATYERDTAGDIADAGSIEGLGYYFERGAAMMRSRLGPAADDLKVSPELMVRVSFAAVLGCVLMGDWIFPEGMFPKETIRSAIIDFTIDGLNANPNYTDLVGN